MPPPRGTSGAAHISSDSKSTGVPIENEREILLANPKVNKRVKIEACGELYNELCKTNPSLFSKAPKGRGIEFEVHYYDSLELLDSTLQSRAPLVCLLHGAPGHYSDFASLINYLTARGCRVVAPSFPDYSVTFKYTFRHSPRERLDYLLKFFKTIGISYIDSLIGHSSAVYTALEMLNHSFNPTTKDNPSIRIKSLGLLNTPTYNLPQNLQVTPFRLFALKLFDYPLLRPIIMLLVQSIARFQGIQNKIDTGRIENFLISASAVGFSDSDKSAGYLQLMRENKVPAFVLVGCKDTLVPMTCFNQLKADLGVTSEDQVKHYDDDGNLVRDVSVENDLVHVSQFARGGHYTFQRYSLQVNQDIYNFLLSKVFARKPSSLTTRL